MTRVHSVMMDPGGILAYVCSCLCHTFKMKFILMYLLFFLFCPFTLSNSKRLHWLAFCECALFRWSSLLHEQSSNNRSEFGYSLS